MIDKFLVNIRKRETPFYDRLYRMGKGLRSFEIPVVPVLFRLLWYERLFRINLWNTLVRVFYTTPIFKSRCEQVGRSLLVIGGVPYVVGDLRIRLGDRVAVHGKSTLNGAKVFTAPTLTVGDDSHLGYALSISVGADVTIGNRVMIGGGVNIMSYDGHPSDPTKRHLPASAASSRPVVIMDNVWIGNNVTILKGVKIGEGAVIAAGSVVTANVPPNCMAIGNPARSFPLMVGG